MADPTQGELFGPPPAPPAADAPGAGVRVRVVDVRRFRPFPDALPFLYVGRRCAGLPGHPLSNPFKLPKNANQGVRAACLADYREWLGSQPGHGQALLLLAEGARAGLPLGCWCGERPPDFALACHAVVLAELIEEGLSAGRWPGWVTP